MSRLIGLVFISASFLIGWLWMDYRDYPDTLLGNASPVVFEVGKGQGYSAVADQLAGLGLVRKPRWFRYYLVSSGAAARIKYGEYEVPPAITVRDLVSMLVAGKVRQHAVTFVEGWRFRQMRERLQQEPGLEQQLAGKSDAEVMTLLGAPGQHPEGLFYPDTYFYTKGMSDLAILGRAYRRMQTVLDEEWRGRAEGLPWLTPYQALIMASIVEKETGRPEERARIAGVFTRRLAQGMLLQTDPTVIYGMGDSFMGDIRRADLVQDTPYNTYVRPGLPPTPIACPGAQAIHAALHPEPGDSLYFVSRGDGTHVFSRSLDEHRHFVEQFQKARKHE
ncbi:endolytic transglycosylase MltG [Methyloterricola oryzae]|uniref:endolytic transglycosylase MltG n=1 Tax=Methyloterricola oryzae TaxID=1495050 RepID=UPI0005EB0532|nr:endolytic transglycosylase MltG [Methyloterricola oryzae]